LITFELDGWKWRIFLRPLDDTWSKKWSETKSLCFACPTTKRMRPPCCPLSCPARVMSPNRTLEQWFRKTEKDWSLPAFGIMCPLERLAIAGLEAQEDAEQEE